MDISIELLMCCAVPVMVFVVMVFVVVALLGAGKSP